MSVLAVAIRPTDGETDDRDLVTAVRAGDDRAFELLYQRYQPRIGGYVRGMVRDDGRAEDITQEVFMAALRRMREDDEREIVFKPWIYEIAKNKCIDAFRRTRHTSEVSFDARDALGADEHDRLAEPGATPDSAVEGKVAIDNLCGAFGGLSQVHHEILVLREFEGLSYREIGDRLGMSRPAVESTLFRARKRLSEEYEELVSGERCLRVQRLVDEHGERAPRLRDRRRMSRHLAHCQPCRRYAGRAGVGLGATAQPAGAAARIAAFLPLPAFLRRRWGGEEAVASPLAGHGGALGQWSTNVATMLDPGVVSGWTKAVATAATVAVAGMGAGAAFTDRAALDGLRDAGARSGAPAALAGEDRAAATRPASAAGPSAAASDEPGRRATPDGRPTPPPAAARRPPLAPAAPHAAAGRGPGRPFDSSASRRPPLGDAAQRSGADIPRPGETLGLVLGAIDGDPTARSTGEASATATRPPQLPNGIDAPRTDSADALGRSVPAPATATAADDGAATAGTDSVAATVSEIAAATTTSAQSLGG